MEPVEIFGCDLKHPGKCIEALSPIPVNPKQGVAICENMDKDVYDGCPYRYKAKVVREDENLYDKGGFKVWYCGHGCMNKCADALYDFVRDETRCKDNKDCEHKRSQPVKS